MRKSKNKNKIIEAIKTHICNNAKYYVIVSIIFIVGLILGVMYINNINEEEINNIQKYINDFITSIKGELNVNTIGLLKSSIWSYTILTIAMWFAGSTVIGIPVVIGIVAYRGFCIGYTISSIILTLGTQKAILFSISTMLLQNVIFIPCLLALAVSGMGLYKSIMKDKRRENIKIEIIRHTLFCIIILIILLVAALIETYISTNLFLLILRFI